MAQDAMRPEELGPEETKVIKERKQAKGIAEAQDKSDLKHIMGTPQGRRAVYRFLNITGLNADPFSGEETNRAHYRMGRASAGREQQNMLLKHCPDEFLAMLKEAKDKDMNDE